MKNAIRLIFFCLIFSISVYAQHKIPQSVIGNGGAVVTNSTHRINGTVGQNFIGVTQNTSFSNSAGFWYIPDKILTSIEQLSDNLPLEYRLHQNYPNPFNPSTTIIFEIPKTSHVSLKIYNLLGQEVAELVNEEKKPGVYNINWDASNLASGIYFYRLNAGEFFTMKKMLIVR